MQSVSVLDNVVNFSDHMPVGLHLMFTSVPKLVSDSTATNKKVFMLHWDKGDPATYSHASGELLRDVTVLNVNNSHSTHVDADVNHCYTHIVHALKSAEWLSIPRIPCLSLKTF